MSLPEMETLHKQTGHETITYDPEETKEAPPVGSGIWLLEKSKDLFVDCLALQSAGQQEYARQSENAFANFDRVAERRNISPEAVLLVYLEKHLDGIHAYVDGHKSQREAVEGRIQDAINYLCILHGMVCRSRQNES